METAGAWILKPTHMPIKL